MEDRVLLLELRDAMPQSLHLLVGDPRHTPRPAHRARCQLSDPGQHHARTQLVEVARPDLQLLTRLHHGPFPGDRAHDDPHAVLALRVAPHLFHVG